MMPRKYAYFEGKRGYEVFNLIHFWGDYQKVYQIQPLINKGLNADK